MANNKKLRIEISDLEDRMKKKDEVDIYNTEISLNNNLYFNNFDKNCEKLKIKKNRFIKKYKYQINKSLNINIEYIYDIENNYGLQKDGGPNIEIDLKYRRNLFTSYFINRIKIVK